MTKEEAIKIISKEMSTAEATRQKEKKIADGIESAKKIFAEWTSFSGEFNAYLKASMERKPGAKFLRLTSGSSREEVTEVFQKMVKIINEATSLIKEMTEFKRRFDAYNDNVTGFIKAMTESGKKAFEQGRESTENYLTRQLGKMNSFDSQADAFLDQLKTYEPRLASIKNQMNIIKGIN